MRPWMYAHLYKKGAPWERAGISPELQHLVTTGRLTPAATPRVIDLGCGTGANAVYLAQQGFQVTGVDFTPIAIERATERAAAAGLDPAQCQFIHGDLAAPSIPGADGPFDLLIDYSTLDDTPGPVRRKIVDTIHRLSRPGSVLFLWCFSVRKKDLPLVRRGQMSRMHTVMAPGEEARHFGNHFDIERLPDPPRPPHAACFLMTRR